MMEMMNGVDIVVVVVAAVEVDIDDNCLVYPYDDYNDGLEPYLGKTLIPVYRLMFVIVVKDMPMIP
ncbi:hypothetical protein BLA29_008735 [Euroglyphus maynei]|uniref:Uncharacterized protein n=1 Tax=Euroglyphus maynei TaxID=6958 RepID=A0A1Y3BHQ9_EURMA|nr:hypothetical protein BLA29_008735 [Euroglyphus maynei]